MKPSNFQEWLELPEKERLKYWDCGDVFGEDELTCEINDEFKKWASNLDGVIEATVGNNHGSLDPRIEWKRDRKRKVVERDFHGILIRNVTEPTEEEINRGEDIANSPKHKITQVFLFIVMIPLAIIGGIVYPFIRNKNKET